jgi:hypothetical protein
MSLFLQRSGVFLPLRPQTKDYIGRVVAEGGEVGDKVFVDRVIGECIERGIYDNLRFLGGEAFGLTLRPSGGDNFVEKLWDASSHKGDYVQSVEALQPKYEHGKIVINSDVLGGDANARSALNGASGATAMLVGSATSGDGTDRYFWNHIGSIDSTSFFVPLRLRTSALRARMEIAVDHQNQTSIFQSPSGWLDPFVGGVRYNGATTRFMLQKSAIDSSTSQSGPFLNASASAAVLFGLASGSSSLAWRGEAQAMMLFNTDIGVSNWNALVDIMHEKYPAHNP